MATERQQNNGYFGSASGAQAEPQPESIGFFPGEDQNAPPDQSGSPPNNPGGDQSAGNGNDGSDAGAGGDGSGGNAAGGGGDGDGGGAQAGGNTGDGGTGAGDNAGDGSGAGDNGGGLADAGGGLISDVVQSAGDLVDGGTSSGNGLIGDIVGTADGVVGDVLGTASDLGGSGTGAGNGLLDGVLGSGDGLLTQVVNTAGGLLGDVTGAIGDLTGSGTGAGNGLLGDIIQTVNNTATDATNAVGLTGDGGLLGGNAGGLLGDVTGVVGDIGGTTGTGGLISDVVNVVNSDLAGNIGADTGGDGSSPSLLASLTDDGSVAHLVNDAGSTFLGDVADTGLLAGTGLTGGDGPIATASVLPNGNGIVDNGVNATVNDPSSSSSPIIDLDAVSNGQNGSSSSLINADALNQDGGPSILANVFSTGGESSGDVTGHVIDLGPAGQTLADANVLTSPDQFQFASLGGTGADSLVGTLTDAVNQTTGDSSVPIASSPSIDVGDVLGFDVTAQGDDAGHTDILATLQHTQVI